ncbi:SAV_2336 N-terminal domain-related protein, partial [Streptomyces sp. T-3]|nr:SAV_2336 N-terminal domain-related protein [Streptomyces sp. T-3]
MMWSPFRGGGAGDGIGPGAASRAEVCADPVWYEIGEAVWLAAERERRIMAARQARGDGTGEDTPGGAPPGEEQPVDVTEGPADTAGPGTERLLEQELDLPFPQDAVRPPTTPALPDPDRSVPRGLTPPPPPQTPPTAATPVDPASLLVDLGRGALLDGSRSIEQSMLPLKRRIDSPHRLVLNEVATAESAAELGVWLPREEPAQERWLTATLVVDTGDSMSLWSHTAQQLAQALRGSGAFRDVRLVHGIDAQGIDADATPSASDGRQVLLVLSDLHADHWTDGSARRVLTQWAKAMPVALVHVLPEHVWARVGTLTGRVRLTSPRPVAANAEWDVAHDGFTMAPDDGFTTPPDEFEAIAAAEGITLPVLTLTAEGLGGWARFTAGDITGPYAVRALSLSAPPARRR